jgi:hypothetical protein
VKVVCSLANSALLEIQASSCRHTSLTIHLPQHQNITPDYSNRSLNVSYKYKNNQKGTPCAMIMGGVTQQKNGYLSHTAAASHSRRTATSAIPPRKAKKTLKVGKLLKLGCVG